MDRVPLSEGAAGHELEQLERPEADEAGNGIQSGGWTRGMSPQQVVARSRQDHARVQRQGTEQVSSDERQGAPGHPAERARYAGQRAQRQGGRTFSSRRTRIEGRVALAAAAAQRRGAEAAAAAAQLVDRA